MAAARKRRLTRGKSVGLSKLAWQAKFSRIYPDAKAVFMDAIMERYPRQLEAAKKQAIRRYRITHTPQAIIFVPARERAIISRSVVTKKPWPFRIMPYQKALVWRRGRGVKPHIIIWSTFRDIREFM